MKSIMSKKWRDDSTNYKRRGNNNLLQNISQDNQNSIAMLKAHNFLNRLAAKKPLSLKRLIQVKPMLKIANIALLTNFKSEIFTITEEHETDFMKIFLITLF